MPRRLTARLRQRPSWSERARVTVNPECLHLYDAEAGWTI